MLKKIIKPLIIILSVFETGRIIITTCIPSENFLSIAIIIFKCLLALVCVYLMKKQQLIQQLGFNKKWWLYVPIALAILGYVFIFLANKTQVHWATAAFSVFVGKQISTGIFEELFFRGFVFYGIFSLWVEKSNATWKAALLTSLLFGFAHLLNMFNKGISIFHLNQVIFAFGIGLVLQSIQIRFENILLPIVLHAAVNMLGSYKAYFNLLTETKEATESDYWMSMALFAIICFFVFLPIAKLLIGSKKPILHAA